MLNDLLSKIDAVKWLALVNEFGLQKLSDPEVLPGERVFESAKELKLFDDALRVSGGALIGVQLLNAESDKDDLKVSNEKANDGLVAPILGHSNSAPLIRYRIGVGAKCRAMVSSDWKLPLMVEGKGGYEFSLYSYIAHNGGDTFFEAARTDSAGIYRTALIYQHVLGLKPGEAVAMRWAGSVVVSASLNWADLLGSVVSTLDPLFSNADPIAVNLTAAIETKLSLSFEDTFLLVFAHRTTGNKPFVVELRKQDNREHGMSAGIRAQLETALSKQGAEGLAKIRNEIVKSVLGVSDPEVQQLKDWVNSEIALPPELAPVLVQLRERLIGDIAVPVEDVKRTLAAWLDDLEKNIVQVAENTLSLSLEWSYRSVRDNDTLIRASFSESEFATKLSEAAHSELKRGKFGLLQETLLGEGDEFFLNTLSKTAISKFASGISIGSWSFNFNRSKANTIKWVQNIDRNWQPSFTRSLDLEGRSSNETMTRKVGVSLRGREFQPADAQTLSNLELHLSLAYTNVDSNVETYEVDDYLDTARIWGALDLDFGQYQRVRDALSSTNKKLKFICSLDVPHTVLLDTLGADSDLEGDRDLWGDAIALSMLSFHFEKGFVDLDRREKAFGPAADFLISKEGRPAGALREIAKRAAIALEDQGFSGWAKIERDADLSTRRAGRERERVHGPGYWPVTKQIGSLRSESIVALHYKFKAHLDNIVGIGEKLRAFGALSSPSMSKREIAATVEDLMKNLGALRDSRVLFRALGAFIVRKDRRLRVNDSMRKRRIKCGFQVYEIDGNGKEEAATAFVNVKRPRIGT